MKQITMMLMLFLLMSLFSNSFSVSDKYSNVAVGKKDKNTKIIANPSLYESLELQKKGLSEMAFGYALKGYHYLLEHDLIRNEKKITIIDFSLPSYKKRLFVIDLIESKLLFHTYVAHGMYSGFTSANSFSNAVSSYKSSIGFYETSQTYMGKNGYSLQLHGLENGINDNAETRAIVIHGASYVSEEYMLKNGFLGRSWGCPAIPENLAKPIIDEIKNGTCLFVYANNKSYLNQSALIQ